MGKGKLSAKDLARIQAVDEGYRATANAVGLMKANTARDDAKLIRTIERDSLRENREATPDQAERFNESHLRPKSRSHTRLGGIR